jgi:thioredoxin-related protein
MSARTSLICIVVALCCGAAFAESGVQIKWAPNIESAQRAAAEFRVPLLIHFSGEGCLPCRTLETNVFSSPEVVEVMNKYFICVQINGTRDRQTMAEYGVHSYPTDVFIGSDGKPLHQSVSPQEVRNYLGMLERVAVQNRDQNALFAGKTISNAVVSAQQPNLQNAPIGKGVQSALPAPGQLVSANGNSANFYQAQGGSTSQQQLAAGAVSSSKVQSGPLVSNQQPQSISGSTIPTGTQVGLSPSYSPSGNDPLKLPHLNQTTPSQMGSYSQIASVDTGAASGLSLNAGKPQSNDQLWINRASNSSTTAENPHFKPVSTRIDQALAPSLEQELPTQIDAGIPQLDTSANSSQLSQPSAQHTQDISASPSSQATLLSPNMRTQIDGYCPVSLRAKQWKVGQSHLSVKHRGQLFLLADEACVAEFLRTPDVYVPVLLGNDPMILLEEGRMVPGSTQFGLFEDRIGPIFFASAESKSKFLANFNANMYAIEAILHRATSSR